MRLLKWIYEKINKRSAPYYYNYSIFTIIFKPIRKWLTNTIAANCPFNCIRLCIYRLCGFKIGKHTFIGMKCYLDDMCYNLLTIGSHVTISYGVFFSCHGKNQKHLPIVIGDNVYIGMRANVISKNQDISQQGVYIGANAVIGACSLVNRNVPEGATAVGIPCRIIEKSKLDDWIIIHHRVACDTEKSAYKNIHSVIVQAKAVTLANNVFAFDENDENKK